MWCGEPKTKTRCNNGKRQGKQKARKLQKNWKKIKGEKVGRRLLGYVVVLSWGWCVMFLTIIWVCLRLGCFSPHLLLTSMYPLHSSNNNNNNNNNITSRDIERREVELKWGKTKKASTYAKEKEGGGVGSTESALTLCDLVKVVPPAPSCFQRAMDTSPWAEISL